MVVTIYNKIHNENDLTKKKGGKTQTNGMYLPKLVIKQNMYAA